MGKEILQLKNVSYQYQSKAARVDAVNGVSYDFEQGLLYTIRGVSGSGKTTLLSLMAGLALPTKGEILYEGVSLAKMNLEKHRRENVAVIYQHFNLLPQLTVMENIMYPMELQKLKPAEIKRRAEDHLKMMGLTENESCRLPATLSGGQQQRVAIARALGTTAKVILADEPTGSLDTANSRTVINILLQLAHENDYCVIVVTHDPDVAAKGNRRLRMKDGRLTDETE